MRRVAIIGLGETHDQQPEDWERWGLPWDGWAPHFDRLFEMHDPSLWINNEKHCARLKEVGVPIWMQKSGWKGFQSVPYPLWAVAAVVGDYFGSSPAYMVALAIHEAVDEIGLWGVDLHEKDGYDHQRPNIEYLLGFAKAKGIEVKIPEGSTLLKYRPEHNYNGSKVSFPQRYGYV